MKLMCTCEKKASQDNIPWRWLEEEEDRQVEEQEEEELPDREKQPVLEEGAAAAAKAAVIDIDTLHLVDSVHLVGHFSTLKTSEILLNNGCRIATVASACSPSHHHVSHAAQHGAFNCVMAHAEGTKQR